MQVNPDIYLLTADLGFRNFDRIRADFPDRFVDVGAAEQLMLGAAVGLAQEGKIPVVYTITSFYWRAAEWIRNYLNHEFANVKLIGNGRDDEYSQDDGFTHYCGDDRQLFGCFPNINTYWPGSVGEMLCDADLMLKTVGPVYMNLRR